MPRLLLETAESACSCFAAACHRMLVPVALKGQDWETPPESGWGWQEKGLWDSGRRESSEQPGHPGLSRHNQGKFMDFVNLGPRRSLHVPSTSPDPAPYPLHVPSTFPDPAHIFTLSVCLLSLGVAAATEGGAQGFAADQCPC